MKNQSKNGEHPYGTMPCESNMERVETMKYDDKKQLMKLLSFFTMGDGGVYIPSRGGNAQFIMNMKKENMDYINWVKDTIEDNLTSVRLSNVPQRGNRASLVRLESNRHPIFTKLRKRIYTENYKGLCPHYLKLLDWEALAILYMSDGGLYIDKPSKKKRLKNNSYNVALHMKRLSYGDQLMLKKALKDYLGLEWNISRHYDKYFLRMRTKDVDRFMENIREYVLDSFSYKLINISNDCPSVEGEDIVRPVQ
jgi:hypothetical protein